MVMIYQRLSVDFVISENPLFNVPNFVGSPPEIVVNNLLNKASHYYLYRTSHFQTIDRETRLEFKEPESSFCEKKICCNPVGMR